jgi:hypothetical protein
VADPAIEPGTDPTTAAKGKFSCLCINSMSGHRYFIITHRVRARLDLKTVIWARSKREPHHTCEWLYQIAISMPANRREWRSQLCETAGVPATAEAVK